MPIPSSHDDLEPKLAQAEAELFDNLEEACALEPENPGEEDTGELLRLEEVLDAARAAAERAVELRRERRARHTGSESAGVREFRDQAGRDWRVWAVVPSVGGKAASSLKRVGSAYERGWLAFESFDGAERRRLPDHPATWRDRDDPGLAELLDLAQTVAPRRRRTESESGESGRNRAD